MSRRGGFCEAVSCCRDYWPGNNGYDDTVTLNNGADCPIFTQPLVHLGKIELSVANAAKLNVPGIPDLCREGQRQKLDIEG